MKRRTLDIAFAVGGALFSVLLLVLGLVLKDQADFAKNYVHDQLLAQKIEFPKAEELKNGEEAKACLVKYAGSPLDSGKKAECWANDYIGLHTEHSAAGTTISDGTNFEGATFDTLGSYTMGILPGKVAEANGALSAAAAKSSDEAVTKAATALDSAIKASVDPAVVAGFDAVAKATDDAGKAAAKSQLGKAIGGTWDRGILAAQGALAKAESVSSDKAVVKAQQALDQANADLKVVNGLRTTMQTGETLRGLLLTTYGFSIFGDRAEMAATVCYLAFGLLLLLSLLGLLHAFFSKHAKDQVLPPVQHAT
ncbi:MAG: hypothetical protein WCI22_17830, partial [Actinomycetota bacterium]